MALGQTSFVKFDWVEFNGLSDSEIKDLKEG